MHPLISLVCFFLFAGFVSFGDMAISTAALFLLIVLWVFSQSLPTERAWQMLRKMKLFFISILILYVWFTPGKLLIPELDNWSPTFEGLLSGIERIVALVLLVIAVDSLLRLLSREKILAGLYYCFYPLHMLGFNRQEFMIKSFLTLEAVTQQSPKTEKETQFKLKRFSSYIDALAAHIEKLLHQSASQFEAQEIIIEIEGPPVWYHWLLPLFVLIYFMGVYTW